ncbi:hypothetical protein [Nocardia goodfellowii]|uniref:Uncharacterized protein n=1 Tax=Nocardia goodfellowii TaxID=882446 RepID=A0ABS4Q9W2_9NOCA|nr:hypothetical protein [Nocardia goodfellowii]MBP2188491.1 hypothetical protein [Nocardia goodfellowii]
MGELNTHTTEQQPDHTEQQQDPAFLAWLAAMDDDLAQLERDDVPALGQLADRWTRDSLRVLERAALRYYPDPDAPDTPAQKARFERLARGVGHIFATTLGGHWVYVEITALPDGPARPHPAVEIPSATAWFDPARLLVHALLRRTGTTVEEVYDHVAAEWREWHSLGQPPLHEWANRR